MTSAQVSEVKRLEDKLAEAIGRIKELEQEVERYRRPKPKRPSDSSPDAAGWSESEQRFRRLFEANNIGVVVANSSGLVLEANDYYLNLVGFTQEDLREGRVSWAVVTPADHASIDEAALRDLRTNGFTVPTEKQYVRPDGARVHVLISGAMLPGPGDKILALVLDLSEKKRAEQALWETQEALRRTNERLEERVRERTAELTETVHQLQQEILQRLEAEQRLQTAYERLNVRAGQLRALTAQLALTEQRERRRLAEVLHDHLQQLLVGAKLRIAMLGRTGDAQVQKAASEIEDLLTESISASRSLTAELSPPILQEEGLQAGLEWLTGWMRETHGLTVTLKQPDTFPRLSPEITLLVFEAVRELLFNVVKHAGVQSATVTVREIDGNLLEVAVSDQGPGFDPASMKAASETEGGFGLFSIRERMSLINGNVVISTSAGKGTLVLLSIPLVQTADIQSR